MCSRALKYISVCAILIFLSGGYGFVYAQSPSTSVSQSIQEYFVAFLNFLSRAWVIPATIAGKLMTNEFVYAKALHLSAFMRRVWTMMRTLANYAIAVIFLYNIFKTIMTGENISKLKEILFSVVKATILINISWFSIAALVDLSIVATSAVGAVPAQILTTTWDATQQKFYVPQEFLIFRDDNKLGWYNAKNIGTGTIWLNDIIPQANNVSGPLFFLGVSVFQLFDKIYLPQESTNLSSITLSTALYLIIILLFTIPICVLAVTNMMRIFWLWLWIMLSPLIALDRSFSLWLKDKATGTAQQLFNPMNLLALIFQPVVVVAALWLSLILIIGIHQAVTGWSLEALQTIQQVLCLTVDNSKESVVGCDGVSFTKIIGWWFGSLTLHLLLALLSSFLLWQMVKLSNNFSSMLSWVAKGMYNFGENALGAIPLVWWQWFSSLKEFGSDYKDAQMRKFDRKVWWESNEAVNKILDKAHGMFWLEQAARDLSPVQISQLKSALKHTDPTKFLSGISTIIKETPKEFRQIKEYIEQWVSRPSTKTWFKTQAQGLKITDTMTTEQIMSHPPFMSFIDAYLSGKNIEDALTQAKSAIQLPKNMDSKVYKASS